MTNLTRTADYLSESLKQLGFIIMSQGHGKGLPLVAFRLDEKLGKHYDEFAIAHSLRERSWVVPAYTMGKSVFILFSAFRIIEKKHHLKFLKSPAESYSLLKSAHKYCKK